MALFYGLMPPVAKPIRIRYYVHMTDFAPLTILSPTPRAGDKEGDAGTVTPQQTGITVKTKPQTQKPSMYKVLLLNDDYTPMEFVVQVLESFFNKNHSEATHIMMHVHKKGVGLCGVYTFEVAETKVMQVMNAARQAQHPLQCTMEKE